MYGVEPEVQPIGETDNRLLRMLARTPTRLIDIDEPGFLRPDWVMTRPRLVGICGSESKAVFLDYASLIDPANASGMQQNPMKNFVSMPHVMGHEVIAEVVAVGPEAEGLEPGDRPWQGRLGHLVLRVINVLLTLTGRPVATSPPLSYPQSAHVMREAT